MGAHAQHLFEGWFVVEEEHLRKINEIIRDRLPEDVDLGISVKRHDSYAFDTESVDVVCAEENSPSREIKEVTFAAKSPELSLWLSFNSQHGAKFNIAGEDRDRVFLLSSDLKSYLDKEIMVFKRVPGREVMKYLPFVAFIPIFGIMAWDMQFRLGDNIDVQALLAGMDINAKLNYLVERRARGGASIFWIFPAMVAVMAIAMFELHTKLLRFLYPSNDFFLGKKKEVRERRAKLRGNLFWGVVVAGLVGVGVTWAMSRTS